MKFDLYPLLVAILLLASSGCGKVVSTVFKTAGQTASKTIAKNADNVLIPAISKSNGLASSLAVNSIDDVASQLRKPVTNSAISQGEQNLTNQATRAAVSNSQKTALIKTGKAVLTQGSRIATKRTIESASTASAKCEEEFQKKNASYNLMNGAARVTLRTLYNRWASNKQALEKLENRAESSEFTDEEARDVDKTADELTRSNQKVFRLLQLIH
jgi:hypothetical protein